jgi:hypothetical protein
MLPGDTRNPRTPASPYAYACRQVVRAWYGTRRRGQWRVPCPSQSVQFRRCWRANANGLLVGVSYFSVRYVLEPTTRCHSRSAAYAELPRRSSRARAPNTARVSRSLERRSYGSHVPNARPSRGVPRGFARCDLLSVANGGTRFRVEHRRWTSEQRPWTNGHRLGTSGPSSRQCGHFGRLPRQGASESGTARAVVCSRWASVGNGDLRHPSHGVSGAIRRRRNRDRLRDQHAPRATEG